MYHTILLFVFLILNPRQSLYQGLFMQLVDDNMVGMFVNNNFLGVIVLGAAFGVALTRLTQKSK